MAADFGHGFEIGFKMQVESTVSPPLPKNAPFEIPRIEAETVLFERLTQNALAQLHAEDFGRAQAQQAVDLCVSYLLSRGLSGLALQPLINLSDALEDLGRGILPELFDPNAVRKAGAQGERKRSHSSAAQQVKICAAACTSALMHAKLSKSKATAQVARAAQNWHRLANAPITANTVANWRQKLKESPATDRSRMEYERWVSAFTRQPHGARLLGEVLRDGPLLTGGTRRTKT